MVKDYNEGRTAEQYQLAKTQPWRSRIEDYSFLGLIGDVSDAAVLDAACGEGHFTRQLCRAGAARVTGFDISERMIEIARQQEAAEPLGIDYHVDDAYRTSAAEQFDLVVSAWLLVYARDREELGRLCRGLAGRVRPGGRFVTLTTNPAVYTFRPDYRKYGFELRLADRAYDGAPIDITVLLAGGDLEVRNYYLPLAAYTSALRVAGFDRISVHQPQLAPSPAGVDDADHWEYFLSHPFFVLIDAIKT